MAGLAMVFDVIARDHASKTFKDIGGAADKTGKQVHDAGQKGGMFGSHMSKGMKTAAVGMAAVGGAAVVFGKQSVDAFTGNTKAAMAMQRAIGGSIEDASRLNFVARESGVSQESFAKSIRLLEKNIASVAGKAGPGAKALASIGINAKDASGKIRPMADLLPDIAEKFAKMPNGPEKTALALKLFGKSGVDMLPMLNKGKEGITDLMKESDKFGLTVGDKNVKDMKANIKQQREWHATLDGVKVQIGGALLPVMTAMGGELKGKLGPAIQGATKFLIDNKETIATLTATVIRFLPQILIAVGIIKSLTQVTKAFTIAQTLLNLVMRMNPIGIVITVIALLVAGLIRAYQTSETFRSYVSTAFSVVKIGALTMAKIAVTAFQFMANIFMTVVSVILNGAAKAFGWVPGLGPKLKGAAETFDRFKTNANKSMDAIKNSIDVNIKTEKANIQLEALHREFISKGWTITPTLNTKMVWDSARHMLVPVGGSGEGFPGVRSAGGRGFLSPPGRPGFPWGHYPSGAIHRALDFPERMGTPLRAGMSGKVMVAGWDTTGFGNVIRTRDSDGNYTIYGHNSRLLVRAGQSIARGQLIAYTGSTGHSSGPHVHVERRRILYDPSTSFNFTSQLAAHAAGVVNAGRSHWALVGERGPELAFVPQGSTILPEDRTRGILNRVGGSAGDGRSALVRIAPEDLVAIEEAAYRGTMRGAAYGAETGARVGTYAGARDGAAEGVSRAAEAARRGARAAAGTRGG